MGAPEPGAGAALAHRGVAAIALRSLDDMLRFAEQVVKGKLCPQGDTAATVAVKLQAGAELGFSPVQALSVMTAINGRVGIMGVGALARLRSSGQLAEPIRMGVEGTGDERMAWIETRRKGEQERMRTQWSVQDAKRAGLWGKAGPWQQYPDDMLQWRAVSRHCKRHWSDVLLGVDIAETIEVYPLTSAAPARAPVGPDPLLIAAAKPEPQPADAPNVSETTILEHKRVGARHGYVCADGVTYGTEDEKLAEAAGAFVGTGEPVEVEYEQRGSKYRLLGVSAVGGA